MNNVQSLGIRWVPAHLEVLEKAFPELVDSSDANALLLNAGKRQVVHYVRMLLKQQQVRNAD